MPHHFQVVQIALVTRVVAAGLELLPARALAHALIPGGVIMIVTAVEVLVPGTLTGHAPERRTGTVGLRGMTIAGVTGYETTLKVLANMEDRRKRGRSNMKLNWNDKDGVSRRDEDIASEIRNDGGERGIGKVTDETLEGRGRGWGSMKG
eukprot:Rmarinus@m.8010